MRIVALISGTGILLKNILKYYYTDNIKKYNIEFVAVGSDNYEAPGLKYAYQHNIPIFIIERNIYKSIDEWDSILTDTVKLYNPDIILLLGYMSILKNQFISTFNNSIYNVHPSLLPLFKGKDSIKQALEAKVKFTGCTIHLVDKGIDTGKIIKQKTVPILENDTIKTLHNRIKMVSVDLMISILNNRINQ